MSTVFGVRTGRGRETVREVFSGHRVSSLSPDEAQRAHQAGYQPSSADDWLIGRDPRQMSPDELRAMGHKTMSPVAAIRLKCLDCAGSSDEVRRCIAVACPSWPFRTGKNPWRAPPSETQRESGRRSIARVNAAAFGAGKMPSLSAEAAAPVPGKVSGIARRNCGVRPVLGRPNRSP